MVALIVGLFAPVGLTVFTIGMDRFQRRMEPPGNRAHRPLGEHSKAAASTRPRIVIGASGVGASF